MFRHISGKRKTFFYYVKEVRLILSSLLITPDRYLTIAGMIIALYGLSLVVIPNIMELANKSFGVSATPWIKVFGGVSVAFSVLFLAPIISFFLTRRDTNDFRRVLANSVNTDKLIKHVAFEAYLIAKTINSENTPDGIRDAIYYKKKSLRKVEILKGVLAKRLMISHRELSDDFFRFSAKIYINRQIYRASQLDKKNYLQEDYEKRALTEGRNEIEEEQKVELSKIQKRADEIKESLSPIDKYLLSVIKTNMDLKKIEFMFQTRSVSAITQYFISIIDNDREELLNGDFNNFAVLHNMQKSHRTGVAIYRAIGIAIMLYLENGGKDDDKLKDRIRAVTGVEPEYGMQYLDRWFKESQLYAKVQRDFLRAEFKRRFSEEISRFRKQQKGGRIYLVICNYSRLVRCLIDTVISAKEFDDIKIVVLVEHDTSHSFGSRLMYHHITTEHISNNGESLVNRTWRSTAKALVSRFDREHDDIFVLGGCDRIGRGLDLTELEDQCETDRTKNISTIQRTDRDRHEDIAYLVEPISTINELRKKDIYKKNEDGQQYVLKEKVRIFIVAGAYKYDLDVLVDQMGSHAIVSDLNHLIPKPRRAGLYQWRSNEFFDVEVLSYPLPLISWPKTLNEDEDEKSKNLS